MKNVQLDNLMQHYNMKYDTLRSIIENYLKSFFTEEQNFQFKMKINMRQLYNRD